MITTYSGLHVDSASIGKLICYPVNHTGANPLKNTIAIIPARFNSTRLPGKALLEIAGKPMICWVIERALAAQRVERVIVATDDQRILKAVQSEGYEAMMTGSGHASGTDRIAEVARKIEDAEIIVNVQGDEPLISPETIDRAVEALLGTQNPKAVTAALVAGIATAWEPIENAADVLNPDVVKIVLSETGRALYFSRSPVPFPRQAVREHGSLKDALDKDPSLLNSFRKHTGLYVYRRDVLLEFTRWSQSELEQRESLEQLRALEHGVAIVAVEASSNSVGVDTFPDLERVRNMIGMKVSGRI
ncbi:MAG TPA: 3-deoxy-manno-octulosonate cytidylyltransferase [Pyrinomonadaceae bacterium]|nr:3-deoxy-manno-octulosonate cytidylyltransferase [Pyrinomonadaceae bacterium]